MKTAVLAVILAATLHLATAAAQVSLATDPTVGYTRLFGLGGRTCKQYDDTGKLFIYSEGLPSSAVISWLQRSDNGTRANVPMPDELAAALPDIPGCLPGKHHAASAGTEAATLRHLANTGNDAASPQAVVRFGQ